jgi:hypothetical protein
VGARLDALAGEDLADVVAEGADLLFLAVDRQRHGLAQRCVGGGGADEREDDRGDESSEQGLVTAEVREMSAHESPGDRW